MSIEIRNYRLNSLDAKMSRFKKNCTDFESTLRKVMLKVLSQNLLYYLNENQITKIFYLHSMSVLYIIYSSIPILILCRWLVNGDRMQL